MFWLPSPLAVAWKPVAMLPLPPTPLALLFPPVATLKLPEALALRPTATFCPSAPLALALVPVAVLLLFAPLALALVPHAKLTPLPPLVALAPAPVCGSPPSPLPPQTNWATAWVGASTGAAPNTVTKPAAMASRRNAPPQSALVSSKPAYSPADPWHVTAGECFSFSASQAQQSKARPLPAPYSIAVSPISCQFSQSQLANHQCHNCVCNCRKCGEGEGGFIFFNW
jgi:hypothetical protein